MLKLIRRFLEAGMMRAGVVEARTEGTPQGGPLSPLLSNILLDDLDRELERRRLAFCRYADDCNIYVGSRVAGERVMSGIRVFLEESCACDQCSEERGGAAMGAEVPGVQRYRAAREPSADRA